MLFFVHSLTLSHTHSLSHIHTHSTRTSRELLPENRPDAGTRLRLGRRLHPPAARRAQRALPWHERRARRARRRARGGLSGGREVQLPSGARPLLLPRPAPRRRPRAAGPPRRRVARRWRLAMAGQRRRHARAPRRSRRARGRRGRLELDRRRGGERALMERDESRAVRRGVREAERLRGERRGRITVEVRPPLARGEQMAQVPLLVCAEAPELREHLGRHAKPPGERPAPPRRLHAAQPRGSKTSRGRCDPAPARLARLRERGCRGATGSSSSAAAPRRRRGTRAPPPPPQGVMRAPTRPAGSVLAATAAPPPAPRLPDSRWLRVRGSRRASTRGESTARAWRRTVSRVGASQVDNSAA